MGNTAIQWTDVTDNIIVAVIKGKILGWFCRKISPGCLNCFAAKLNLSKFFKGNNLPYSGEPPELHLRRELIASWPRQTKPKRHFVSSMTDVFGEWVPREWIFEFLDGMAAASKQTFQVLTKRPDVALRETDAWLTARGLVQLPPNIQIGVSIEDQPRADERLPILREIRAAVRFLSVEPLLEHVELLIDGECSSWACPECGSRNVDPDNHDPQEGKYWKCPDCKAVEFGEAAWKPDIHWVIAGCESGPKRRPSPDGVFESLRTQCAESKVAFFMKQMEINGKVSGDLETFPKNLQVREFPVLEVCRG